MIVKNEERCIQRCLESAKPFVQRLIVVDTGSTDNTVKICKNAGAQVHSFAWCNDFSAARNYSLSLSESDWNLVLDADEWLVSGNSLHQVSLEKPAVGLIKILNEHNLDDEKSSSVAWVPRLLPRGTRYEGIVHEQPVSSFPRVRLDIVVRHDGYTDENRSRKSGRNKQLLLKALEKSPRDPYLLYQLGVDEEIHGNFSLAADFYEKAHARIEKDYSYKQVMVVRWLYCLSKSKRTDFAISIIDSYRDSYSSCPDFFFAAGNVFLDHAMLNPTNALRKWLPIAVECWEKCLVIGERPDMEGAVYGRGSFLAAKNLYAIYETLGDKEKAGYYLELSGVRP